jgi:torulene dioxygenase
MDKEVEEDDGVLLSQVYDGDKRDTFLLVLNAKTMAEIGRFYTGLICPVSFHGQMV